MKAENTRHSDKTSFMGKALSLILAGGLLSAALLPTPTHAAPSGGMVRIVSVGEPSLLNPVFDMSPAAEEFYNLIYSGLIQENARAELEPDLLEVVPTAANGMVKMTSDGGMSFRAHVIIAILTLVGLAFVVRMVRRHRLKSKYTMLWLSASAVIMSSA